MHNELYNDLDDLINYFLYNFVKILQDLNLSLKDRYTFAYNYYRKKGDCGGRFDFITNSGFSDLKDIDIDSIFSNQISPKQNKIKGKILDINRYY